MQRLMKRLETKSDPAASLPPAKDSVRKCKVMAPAKAMALREEAYRILGVDLTTIPRNQCPARSNYPRGVWRRRIEIPQCWCVQFVDGIMPGQ